HVRLGMHTSHSREDSMSTNPNIRAVVIGGTHGIGLAVVTALLERDAQVLLTGSNPDRIESARRGLASPRAHVVASDVADRAAIERLASIVREQLGGIDLIHFNAGFATLEPFAAVTAASF